MRFFEGGLSGFGLGSLEFALWVLWGFDKKSNLVICRHFWQPAIGRPVLPAELSWILQTDSRVQDVFFIGCL